MADDKTTGDKLADAVRAAWQAHAELLRNGASDADVRRAFVATLRAERALEADCMATCESSAARAAYADALEEYDARIAYELLQLGK